MKFIMENWKRKIQESNASSFIHENNEINDSTDLLSLDVSTIKDEDLKAALELFEEEMRQLAYELQLAKRAKDGEQDAEDARADRAALKPKINAIKKRLQDIANAANATTSPEDDKAVADKVEDAVQKVNSIEGETASNDEVESQLEPVLQDLNQAADIVKQTGGEEQGQETQERQTITLNNNTPKLQQLANAFVQLSDEQYDQLRQELGNELEKARIENYDWQDLPQGLQNFENSALFMFSPEGNGYTLKPEVTNIVPIKNDADEDVTFEITQDEFEKQYQANQENMEEIGDKLEQEGKQEMTNDQEQGGDLGSTGFEAIEDTEPVKMTGPDERDYNNVVSAQVEASMDQPEDSGYTTKDIISKLKSDNPQEVEDVIKRVTGLDNQLFNMFTTEQHVEKITAAINDQFGDGSTTDSGEQAEDLEQKINAAAEKMKSEGKPDLFKGINYKQATEVLRKLGFDNLPEDFSSLSIEELQKVQQTVDKLKAEIEEAYETLDGDASTTDSGEQTSEPTEQQANKIYGDIAKRMQGILKNPKFGTQQVRDVKITQFFNSLRQKDFEKYKIAVGNPKVTQGVFDRLADIVEKFPPSSTENGEAVQDLLNQANQRLGTQTQDGEPEETEADFPEGTSEEIQNSVLQIFEKVKDQIEEETHVPTKRALAKFLGLYLEANKEPETITENNMELALDMNDAFVRAYRVLKTDEQELVSTAFNKLDSKAFNEKFKLVDADLSPEDEEGEEESTNSIDTLLQLDGEQFMTALTKFYRENELIDKEGIKKSLLTLLNAFKSTLDDASEPTPEPEEMTSDKPEETTDTTPIDDPEEEVESLPENLLEGIYLINEQEEQSEVGKAIATLTNLETIPDTIIPFEKVGELRDKLKSILKVKDEQVKSPDAAELTSEDLVEVMAAKSGKDLIRAFLDILKQKFDGNIPKEFEKSIKLVLRKEPSAIVNMIDSPMLKIDVLDGEELAKKIAKFYPPDEELDSGLSAGLNSSQKKILKAIKSIFAARKIQKIDGDKAQALDADFQSRFANATDQIAEFDEEVMRALAISLSRTVGKGVFAESKLNEFVFGQKGREKRRKFQQKYMGGKVKDQATGLEGIMKRIMDRKEFISSRGRIYRTFETPEFRSFYGDLRDLLMNIVQNPEEIKIDDETVEVIIDVDDFDLDDGESEGSDEERGEPTITPGEQTGLLNDLPEKLQDDVKESKTWINSLPKDERTSVEIFVSRMVNSGAEILPPTEDELENVDEAMTDFHRDKIKSFKNSAGTVFPNEFASAMEKTMEELQDADRDRVANLMYTEEDRFVNYLTTVFTLKQELGAEPAKSIIGLPTPSGEKMTDPDDDFGDSPFSDIDARGEEPDESGVELPNPSGEEMTNPEDVATGDSSPFDKEDPDTSDDSDFGIDPEKRGDEEDGIEDSDFADKNTHLGKVGLLADKYVSYSKNKNSARGQLKQLFGTITDITNEMKRKRPNLKSRDVIKALMSLALIYATPEDELVFEKKNKKKNNSDVEKAKGKIRPILAKLERYEESLGLSREERSLENLKLIIKSVGGPMANLFKHLKSSKSEVLRLVNTFKTKDKALADLEDGGVEKLKGIGLEEALKPIIERMLSEHYTGV